MLILLIVVGISGVAWNNQRSANSETGFRLRSPSFKNNETLPAQFTCDGDNLSPEFTIKDIPKETVSLAFIVEDQDLDKKQLKELSNPAHLMVWNIPVGTTKFTQGIRPPGTIGRNIFGNFAYGGPCPPEGQTHDYTFTLYAIGNNSLSISSDTSLAEVKKAIENNFLAKTKLTASYTRTKK